MITQQQLNEFSEILKETIIKKLLFCIKNIIRRKGKSI